MNEMELFDRCSPAMRKYLINCLCPPPMEVVHKLVDAVGDAQAIRMIEMGCRQIHNMAVDKGEVARVHGALSFNPPHRSRSRRLR